MTVIAKTYRCSIFPVFGDKITLSSEKRVRNGYAEAIAVAGSDVYIAGEEWGAKCNIAKYWKNGEAVYLSDGIHNAAAYAITVVR